ncbi:MAG: radical SAM protein [Thermotogae bacterium]|nr:radical SAM protein [Thermotogota bacterium]MCP5465746.1 radical SAM protein [Thermotogota bacterium]
MKKRFKKIYVEITNYCDMNCPFCKKDNRSFKTMTKENFNEILEKTADFTDYYNLYVKGEPLIHKDLDDITEMLWKKNKNTVLSTNGFNIKEKTENLRMLDKIYRINISLHSFTYDNIYKKSLDSYLKEILDFITLYKNKFYISLRLWNQNVENSNKEILDFFRTIYNFTPENVTNSIKISDKLYFNFDSRFEWPSAESSHFTEKGFCYGLRDHIAVLSDGKVVPCCLDSDGIINLGNLYRENFSDILNNKRTLKIYNGFSSGNAVELLCKKCSFKDHLRK